MPAMSIALATKNRNNYNKDIGYLFRLKEYKRLKEKKSRLWIFKRRIQKMIYECNEKE